MKLTKPFPRNASETLPFKHLLPAAVLGSLLLLTACSDDDISPAGSGGDTTDTSQTSETDYSTDTVLDADFEATDWTDETHSKDVNPDFDEVFDDSQVKRLDFVITQERWQSMLDDMTAIYGEFGGRSCAPGGNAGGNAQPAEAGSPPNSAGTQLFSDTGALVDTDEDPIIVPGEVFYNSKQWYRVGLHIKGNSSLKSAWEAGILKLSFKIDFDDTKMITHRSKINASTGSRNSASRTTMTTVLKYEKK